MPEAKSLGSVAYLRSLADGFESGTGADRQLRVWKESGDLKEVLRENARQLSREVCPDRGYDL